MSAIHAIHLAALRLAANARDDERGVTAIEYALLAALIAVAIITAVTLLGTDLTNTFTSITNAL